MSERKVTAAKRVVFVEKFSPADRRPGDGFVMGPLSIALLASFLRLEADEDKRERIAKEH